MRWSRHGRAPLVRWTEAAFRAACARERSAAAVLAAFAQPLGAAGYRAVNRSVAAWSVDIAHWTGSAHGRGVHGGHGRPLAELLVRDSPTRSPSGLKIRIVGENVLPYVCFGCGSPGAWQGHALTLHLDHANGDPCDWRLENLRFACPNCHAQTETYCRRSPSPASPGRFRHRPVDFAKLAARHR